MRALKAFAALLSYPDTSLRDALPEIRAAIDAERRLGSRDRRQLDTLIDSIERGDLLDRQEAYVALFDRGRATSLNLYEHLHGDSRDRGQAMVELANVYRNADLELSTRELPDHLPVVLEYLSTRPVAEIKAMLGDCAHLVRAIGEALAKRGSPYAAVLAALLSLAGERSLKLPDAPRATLLDEERLDDEWIEQPVLFGLGCGDARDPAGAQPVRFVRKSA